MENNSREQDQVTGVFELPGEPAIVINGVPDVAVSTTDGTLVTCNVATDTQPKRNPGFGEWLEGREVWKLFEDKYYTGTVTMYDKEAGWYRVVYDDGDFEDLEWNELEEVLQPLDVSIPLKALAMKMMKRSQKPAKKSGGKRGRPRKHQVQMVGKIGNSTVVTQGSLGNNAGL